MKQNYQYIFQDMPRDNIINGMPYLNASFVDKTLSNEFVGDMANVCINDYVTTIHDLSSALIDNKRQLMPVWSFMIYTDLGKLDMFSNLNTTTARQYFDDIHHITILHQFNYRKMKVKELNGIIFSKNGDALSVFNGDGNWIDIEPHSHGQFFINCLLTADKGTMKRSTNNELTQRKDNLHKSFS